ncbi:hypothetical protein Bca52824_054445 [Brassica carinata]|uniref:Uncharacterized protein n=1 Tax=Brassica carinata TaxID=52824 RepID=A0A8X7R9V5_BRACI|nr:hypothetical protein Bca52824_054445 [Brassica carinata]
MHCIRSSILQHLRLRVPVRPVFLLVKENAFISQMNFTSGGGSQDQVLSKVIELVKKYDTAKISKIQNI